MSDWLPLPEVASCRRNPSAAVALRAGRPLDRSLFGATVAAWQRAWATVKGPDVGLYIDDSFDFACALFGAWHAGKQVWLPGDRAPATVEQLRARVDAVGGDLPGALAPVPAEGMYAAPCEPPAPLTRGARLVVFTSGSTGEPAAIAKQLHQLDAEVHVLEAVFGGAAAAAVVQSTVSHQHIYGLLFRVLWPLAAGRAFACERLEYPEQIAALPANVPTLLVASPAHLRRLAADRDWGAARASLRAVFSSGGPLAPEAAQQSLDLLGHSPAEVYGSSETGGIAWRRRSVHGDAWQALPGVEWRMEGERLSVRSAHLPDTAWTPTQDRVAAVAPGAGSFVLLGREDRIVKIEEKRVSLGRVEQLLLALPEIAEARAFVLSSPGGDRVAVVAVPTGEGWRLQAALGRKAFNDRLRAALALSLEPAGMPRRFRLVRSFPADAQGKVTGALLAALFRPTLPPVRWLQREVGQARARLQVDAGLAVFDGHFEGMPVLPGVAQIDWVATLAGQCFDLPARFLRAEQIKFLRPVCPPLDLTLDLVWSSATGSLQFQLASAQGAHASGRLLWGAAHG